MMTVREEKLREKRTLTFETLDTRSLLAADLLTDLESNVLCMEETASVPQQDREPAYVAAFMEAECFDSDGKLVAKATATAIPMEFKRLE